MQTTINPAGQPIGLAGQKYDNSFADIVSMFNADTASIPFGCGVAQGTGQDQNALLPHAITDKIVGVSVWGLNHVHNGYSAGGVPNGSGDLDGVGLITGGGMQIMRRGRIWVLVEEAVNPEDRAYCRAVANTGTGNIQLGGWRKSADGSNCIDVRRVAVFRTVAAAGGLACLEVNFTVSPSI